LPEIVEIADVVDDNSVNDIFDKPAAEPRQVASQQNPSKARKKWKRRQ
jgi:hypothetical protein